MIIRPTIWRRRPVVTEILPEHRDAWISRPREWSAEQRLARRNWRWSVVAMVLLVVFGAYLGLREIAQIIVNGHY